MDVNHVYQTNVYITGRKQKTADNTEIHTTNKADKVYIKNRQHKHEYITTDHADRYEYTKADNTGMNT